MRHFFRHDCFQRKWFSEKLIFLIWQGFMRLNIKFFKYQPPHFSQTASKTTFFFLASQDIVWNIVCTNYEHLITQRTCCANEIAFTSELVKKPNKNQIKTKSNQILVMTAFFFVEKKKNLFKSRHSQNIGCSLFFGQTNIPQVQFEYTYHHPKMHLWS